jgi:hypothetical protein
MDNRQADNTAKHIERELQKFNVTDAEVARLRDECGALTISGIEDTAGYKLVDASRKKIKELCIKVDKKRKELTEDSVKVQRGINSRAKQIIEPLRQLESDLAAKQKVIDDEKQAILRVKHEMREQRFQSRMDDLRKFGFRLVANFMISNGDEKFSTDEIRNWEADYWLTIFGRLNRDYVAEQKRLLDIEFERQEQLEREEKERADEKARLQLIHEQQLAESKRLEETRKQIRSERMLLRVRQLEAENLGLVYDSNTDTIESPLIFDNLSMKWDSIAELSDDEFKDLINDFRTQHKINSEQREELERTKRSRQITAEATLTELGFTYDIASESFEAWFYNGKIKKSDLADWSNEKLLDFDKACELSIAAKEISKTIADSVPSPETQNFPKIVDREKMIPFHADTILGKFTFKDGFSEGIHHAINYIKLNCHQTISTLLDPLVINKIMNDMFFSYVEQMKTLNTEFAKFVVEELNQ